MRPSLLLILMLMSPSVFAQSLRLRTEAPKQASEEEETKWPAFFRYSMVSDFADSRTPRAYTHAFFGSIGYQFSPEWSVNLEAGIRAELVDGQINKGEEQSYAETMNPSTALELDYERKFYRWSYNLNVHGEPLWDTASRLEGYKGLVGAGGDIGVGFFGKRLVIKNSIDGTSLLNTFYFGTNKEPNPDYFLTYKLANSIRFLGSYKFTYTFGFKSTRYLDGFWGYNYSNQFALSKAWKSLSVAVAYDNGGFTDDGEVSLWYIDEYRRVGRLIVSYAF